MSVRNCSPWVPMAPLVRRKDKHSNAIFMIFLDFVVSSWSMSVNTASTSEGSFFLSQKNEQSSKDGSSRRRPDLAFCELSQIADQFAEGWPVHRVGRRQIVVS